MISTEERKKIGKKNRINGANFERKVRSELEKKGWIVARWTNQLEEGKIIPAKVNFRFGNRNNGFPDYIAFKINLQTSQTISFRIVLIECKLNAVINKEELAKINLLQDRYLLEVRVAFKEGKKTMYKQRLGQDWFESDEL